MGPVKLTDKVTGLSVSTRIINCLCWAAEVDAWRDGRFDPEKAPMVQDIVHLSEAELLRVPNLGRKSFRELREALFAQVGVVNLPVHWVEAARRAERRPKAGDAMRRRKLAPRMLLVIEDILDQAAKGPVLESHACITAAREIVRKIRGE